MRRFLRRSALAPLAIPALLALPPAASAACTAPEPPAVAQRPAKPALPQKPACLDAKAGCPGWEAYSYNDAVKAYNEGLKAYRPLAEAYVQRLNAYVKGSATYAECEVKALQ